jgi:hypothetical protein
VKAVAALMNEADQLDLIAEALLDLTGLIALDLAVLLLDQIPGLLAP